MSRIVLPPYSISEKSEPVYFKCYAHLNNVAIPIHHDYGNGNSHFILGEGLNSYDDLVEYRNVADKLGIDADRISDVIRGVSVKNTEEFKPL